MPPVLYVPLHELARGGAKNMAARFNRHRIHEGERILQLVAKTVGPAGLIESRASPHPATENLIELAVIEEQVEGLVRRADDDSIQHSGPKTGKFFPCRLHVGRVAVILGEA